MLKIVLYIFDTKWNEEIKRINDAEAENFEEELKFKNERKFSPIVNEFVTTEAKAAALIYYMDREDILNSSEIIINHREASELAETGNSRLNEIK